MLTSKIASPGVVIDELSAFPADVTPVASAMPPFLGSTDNAPAMNAPVLVTSLKDSSSTSEALPPDGSILSSEEVNEREFPPSE
jgi:hypothetical protein